MINRGTTKVSKVFKGTSKVKYIYKGTTKVWSGASVVSYYDGNTLIGTEEVDEGLDILHPSFSTAKEGYTLYGWTNVADSDERITVATATGEPMTLYAIYLPNTLTVISGTVSNNNTPTYSRTVFNTKFVSGNPATNAEEWYASIDSTKQTSASITLDKKYYQTAKVTVKGLTRGYGHGKFDGHTVVEGDSVSDTYTNNNLSNGSHTITSYVYVNYSGTWIICCTGITSLTLTNPIAWE